MDAISTMHLVLTINAVVAILTGTIVAAIAQTKVIVNAIDAMTKQPELSGEVRFTMIIGLAMIESLAIYCLLIALVLLFARW